MNLTNLAPLPFWLGLGAIAAGLFALQRLRIRHREVEVPTLLFWQEAMEDAPARVLVERFRHPLAYLLVLALAGGMWLAFGAPGRSKPADGSRYTLLIDASACMAAEGRLEAAVQAASELAADLPELQRSVIWCGAEPHTVLLPGEPAVLLGHRVQGLGAEAAPESLSRALRTHRASLSPEGGGLAIVLGDAALEDDAANPRELSAGGMLRWPLTGLEPGRNAGVVALGATPAESGDPAAVDVLVATRGTGIAPVVELEGEALRVAAQTEAGGRKLYLFTDVPAAGGTVRASLAGAADSIALDDSASRVLPIRRALRVAVDPALDATLRGALDAVLAADRGVLVTEANPDVVLRSSPAFASGLPALELVASESQVEPILIGHAAGLDSAAVAAELVPALGLDRFDAQALATALGAPLAVGARPADQRTLQLWSDLLDPAGADLASSRAFPALVARGLRWLSDRQAFPVELAAGRPLSAAWELSSADGEALLAFGAAPVPPVAASWIGANGGAQPVALLADLAVERAAEEPDVELASASSTPLSLLILALLALLGLEWALVRTGRMP